MKIIICDAECIRYHANILQSLLHESELIQNLVQTVHSGIGSVSLLHHSCIIVDRPFKHDISHLTPSHIQTMISFLIRLPIYRQSIESDGICVILVNRMTSNLYTESKYHNSLFTLHPSLVVNEQC